MRKRGRQSVLILTSQFQLRPVSSPNQEPGNQKYTVCTVWLTRLVHGGWYSNLDAS